MLIKIFCISTRELDGNYVFLQHKTQLDTLTHLFIDIFSLHIIYLNNYSKLDFSTHSLVLKSKRCSEKLRYMYKIKPNSNTSSREPYVA